MKHLLVLLFLCLPGSAALVLGQDEKREAAKTPETLSGRPLNISNLARLPYRQLIKIAQSDGGSKPDAETYKLRIKSQNPKVESKDIELFLNLKEGPMVVVVNDQGFLEIPHNKELLEANPELVANQPRGTLNIFVDIEVPKVSPPNIVDGKVKYQELFRPLVEIQNEMRKVDPTFGLGGQQFVLEIETDEEPIKITRTLGARTFRPNSRGKVYMIMEAYLYEENPDVEIPDDAKMNVLPATPEEIEDIRSR